MVFSPAPEAAAVRIRQVALVAHQLEPVVADLCAVLGVEICYRDEGVGVFGLENALMPVGDTLLEVVSPIRPETSAGRYLDRRGGNAGYMIIIQSEDLEADRRRLNRLGVRIVWETALSDIETIHLHPHDLGGAILSLDVAKPPESWRWAGPDWRSHVRTELTAGIVAAELRTPDAEALARRWSQVLDRPVESSGDDTWTIPLAGSAIRFVADPDGQGFAGFDVIANDRARILDAAKSRGLKTNGNEVHVGGSRITLR